MPTTPRSLLLRLQDQGDPRDWDRLVALYEPIWRGYLSGAGLQKADADDVLQEVFLVVRAKVPSFRHNGEKGAFRKWLRGIVQNKVIEFGRRRRNYRGVPLDEGEASLAHLQKFLFPSDAEEIREVIRRLLALLEPEFEPRTIKAVVLLIMRDCPVAEVARKCDMTPNAVYIAKSRVLRRLRPELEGLLGHDALDA